MKPSYTPLWPHAFSVRLKAASDLPTEQKRIEAIDRITDAMADAGLVRPRTEYKIAPNYGRAQWGVM